MMQQQKHKKMTGTEDKAKKKVMKTYHFAGGKEYVPQSVQAQDIEEATKQWKKTRIKSSLT